MDRIQPFSGPARPQAPAGLATDVGPAKSPADYLRALRRRAWMVVALAVPVAVAGAVFAARQPAIYQAQAHIQIEPPRSDPVLASMLPSQVGALDPEARARYVPNHIAKLRSPILIEDVLREPGVVAPPGANPVADLIAAIQTRQIPGSNHLVVSLEGPDPARAARMLQSLLEVFQRQAREENFSTLQRSKDWAEDSLKEMRSQLAEIDNRINTELIGSPVIGPNGQNLLMGQYETIQARLGQLQMRHDEVEQQARVARMFPNIKEPKARSPFDAEMAQLERERKRWTSALEKHKRTVRNFNSDPAVRHAADQLNEILTEIEELKSLMASSAEPEMLDATDTILQHQRSDIQNYEEASRSLLRQLQESSPTHQRFVNLLDERRRRSESIAQMENRLGSFVWLMKTQNDPITIPTTIAEPTRPIRPNRLLFIGAAIVLGLALGMGVVCLVEHVDHSVKVPEHLTAVLPLPLFGVIPRIRRTAQVARGGHLWTAGAPRSIEADAFRNLRASLLGLSGPGGMPVTLLITSAKAGEGKSTTALNLAATCARAGERTLLVDVDLRRPSLSEVFPGPEDGHDLGLVDVLRDDLPWSRAVLRTDLPNLDFLPTGDTTRIPIEILGSREMRQLLESLATSHYDRVILDGPAVLGLADCRMLGRMVDAALLVVRSGSIELRPLKRARAMLEQSQVPVAGVVFNGLSEDLRNWSSYGPPAVDVAAEFAGRIAPGGGLSAPAGEPAAALPAAHG